MGHRRKHCQAPGGSSAALATVMEQGGEIHDIIERIDQALARRLGVNRNDLRCLFHLHDKGSATPTEIAAATQLTSGSVTALIDRLEGLGMAERSRRCSDRRSVAIALVPEQADMMERLAEDIDAVFAAKLGALPAEELERLAVALPHFVAALSSAAAAFEEGALDSVLETCGPATPGGA